MPIQQRGNFCVALRLHATSLFFLRAKFAKKNAKVVAQRLKISEPEAEARIIAELQRNSDKQTADATGCKHGYELCSAITELGETIKSSTPANNAADRLNTAIGAKMNFIKNRNFIPWFRALIWGSGLVVAVLSYFFLRED